METETVTPSSGAPSPIAVSPSVPPPGSSTRSKLAPASCPSCAGGMDPGPPAYVYALGRIEARFPNLAVEKEFAQAAGRADTAGKTNQQTFHAVLSKREHRYLARQLCWVLTVQPKYCKSAR